MLIQLLGTGKDPNERIFSCTLFAGSSANIGSRVKGFTPVYELGNALVVLSVFSFSFNRTCPDLFTMNYYRRASRLGAEFCTGLEWEGVRKIGWL